MSRAFKPTYLYIKTHNETGLKYFGKTSTKDPMIYKGSGTRWVSHLKKHGNNVSTEIYGYYTNEEECKSAALEFSAKHNIVESNQWANLKPESLDGGGIFKNDGSKEHIDRCKRAGKICHEKNPDHYKFLQKGHTPQTRKKAKQTLLEEHGEDFFKSIASKSKTDEHKQKLRESALVNQAGKSNLGLKRKKVKCPHCGKEGAMNVMGRYHFDQCKNKLAVG